MAENSGKTALIVKKITRKRAQPQVEIHVKVVANGFICLFFGRFLRSRVERASQGLIYMFVIKKILYIQMLCVDITKFLFNINDL